MIEKMIKSMQFSRSMNLIGSVSKNTCVFSVWRTLKEVKDFKYLKFQVFKSNQKFQVF